MTEKEKEKVNREEVLNRLMRFLENPNSQLTQAIVSNNNEVIRDGTSIIANSRVISGNANRLLMLLQLLKDKGLPSANKYINYIAINTKGFSKEIPDYGLRGEVIDVITRQLKPKPEQNAQPQGVMRQGNQPVQMENQQ